MAVTASEGHAERIALVALELFNTQGYDRTSLRQIAAALDLSKSGLYHHFSAKDALLDYLIHNYQTSLKTSMATRSAAESSLSNVVGVMLRHRGTVRLLSSDPAAAHAEAAGEVRAMTEHLWQAAVAEVRKAPRDLSPTVARAALAAAEVIVTEESDRQMPDEERAVLAVRVAEGVIRAGA